MLVPTPPVLLYSELGGYLVGSVIYRSSVIGTISRSGIYDALSLIENSTKILSLSDGHHHVPTIKNYYGDSSVTVYGGNIWNKLPLNISMIRTCASLQGSRHYSKLFFFDKPMGWLKPPKRRTFYTHRVL